MKVLFKSLLTKITVLSFVLINVLGGTMFLLLPKQADAASYNDISAMPAVPSRLPDGSANPVPGYSFSFVDNGDSILIKGAGITAGKEVKFRYETGKVKDSSGQEISFKYYRPPLLPSASDYRAYTDLFFNNNIGYIESDNLLTTPLTCQRNSGGHIRIVGFLPRPGITIDDLMQQAYDGNRKINFAELISSGTIIPVPKSPYNAILCSYGPFREDGEATNNVGDFNGFNSYMGIGAYRINISGAGSGDTGGDSGETWYGYDGKAVVKENVDRRFVFVNPKTIVDTNVVIGGGERIIYQLSEDRDKPYPDDNSEFWNEGVAIYKPFRWKNGTVTAIDKSETGNKCLGFFLADTRGKNDGEVYGDVYGIPSGDVNGRCYIDKKTKPAAQFWGFFKDADPDDIVGQELGELIKKYKITSNINGIKVSGEDVGRQRALFFARLLWNSPTDIRTYGTNVQLKLQNQAEETRVLGAITNLPSISKDAQVWTTDECKIKNNVDYPFILIDYSNQYSNLQDNAVDNQNALGRIYIPNTDTLASDWTNKYNGSATECLFGNKVKYNWVGEDDYRGNEDDGRSYTFIGNLAKSVGNKEDSIDHEDAPDPENESGNINGGSPTDPNCISTGFSLSWLICPIIDGISKTADGLFKVLIESFLKSDPIDLSRTVCQPNQTNKSKCIYSVWSNFRNVANVLLILFLLLAIYGQATGGGAIDAYTAKKIIPRLVAAVILINLSIYLVALAIDVTNIIGGGIVRLIYAPFGQSGLDFTISGGVSLGFLAGTGATVGAFWLLGGALVQFLALFVLLPAVLAFLGVLVTLTIRHGLIIFLTLSAPVALALYVLPNTEKYAKAWWNLLLKTLLVYPIIMIIFAVSHVIPGVFGLSGQTGLASIISTFMSLIALVAPLFLVPFAFKLAGGAIGTLFATLSGWNKRGSEAIKGNINDQNSLRNRTKYKMGDRTTLARERAVTAGKKDDAGFGRRTLGRALNYGNLQAKRAAYNKMRSGMLQDQIGTGDDSNIRDLFIAWDDGSTGNKAGWYRRMDMENGRAIAGASSVYGSYQAGKTAHAKSMSLYKGDKSAVQDALYYEWKKTGYAASQMERIENQYGEILGEHGFTDDEGTEMMKGVGFRHQQGSLYSKYSSYKSGKGFKTDIIGMAKEGAHNIGTYQHSNLDVKTYRAYESGYQQIAETLATGEFDANGIVTSGELAGKSRAQLEDAHRQLEAIADNVNPNQRQAGANVQVGVQADGTTPQMAGFGISSAPVEVQAAATQFYSTVATARAQRQGGNGSNTPGGTPGGTPGTGGGGSPLVTPGSPGYTPPSSGDLPRPT